MTESATRPAVPPWQAALTDLLRQEAAPPHKFGHQPRLFALTQAIVRASPSITPDEDVLFAAAFLHDLGVFIKHRPEDPEMLRRWDHVAYICDRAPTILARIGFPAHKIPAVLAAIREHQPQNNPTSPEATVLRDADILEQLGAIAVMRTASKLGSDTRFHTFTEARRSLQQALDVLPVQLRLPASRQLAEPRIAATQNFLAALDAEAGEHLG